MDLDDLFGMDAPFAVQTWQFNGPDRVTSPGGSWDTEEAALARASSWSGVATSDFTEAHRGKDMDALATWAYDQKVGLVVVFQGDNIIQTAPLDGSWKP